MNIELFCGGAERRVSRWFGFLGSSRRKSTCGGKKHAYSVQSDPAGWSQLKLVFRAMAMLAGIWVFFGNCPHKWSESGNFNAAGNANAPNAN